MDWNLDQNNTLTVKYNYLNSSREIQASNSGSVNSSYGRAPGQYAMPFYGSGYKINNNFNIIIAELNTRLGNKASNKLQVGYTALRDFRSPLTSSPIPVGGYIWMEAVIHILHLDMNNTLMEIC